MESCLGNGEGGSNHGIRSPRAPQQDSALLTRSLSKLDHAAVMFGAMNAPSWLVLVPTSYEARLLGPYWKDQLPPLQRTGFGPVAAAASASRLIATEQPERVLLLGIAGSFDLERLPVGAAHTFDEVVLDHLGVGYGRGAKSAEELGFAQLEGGRPLHDRAALDTRGRGAGLLVTTPVAAAHSAEAARRRARYGNPLAEDMEGFGVAAACHLAGVPLTIVRGASNTVGDRDKERWRVRTALEAAATLAAELLTASEVPGP